MRQHILVSLLCISTWMISSNEAWSRGGGGMRGGGGGFSGGVSRGGGGGGFFGGARPSPSINNSQSLSRPVNRAGGISSAPNIASQSRPGMAAPRPSTGNIGNSLNRGPGGPAVGSPGIGQAGIAQRPVTGAVGSNNRTGVGQAISGNQYHAPSRSDLSGFLDCHPMKVWLTLTPQRVQCPARPPYPPAEPSM